MAIHELDYIDNRDLQRNFHCVLVEYKSKHYYILNKNGSFVEAIPLQDDGMYSDERIQINMNERPEFKIPKLGYFLNPKDGYSLVIINRSVRRQWMFGVCPSNVVSYQVGFDKKGALSLTYRQGISAYLFETSVGCQMSTRNKTLDDWDGRMAFVLRPDFAVYNGKLLHTDGVIGELDIQNKRVVIQDPELDDSLMRDQIQMKLGWRVTSVK